MSSYTKSSIPPEIREQLEKKLGCNSLADLKGADFTRALRNINETVDKRREEDTRYQRHFDVPLDEPCFHAKSLRRYFDGENIRLDKLNALKCFLGYDPDTLKTDDEPATDTPTDAQHDYLTGKWYSYVYDIEEPTANKVKRTVLFLDKKNQLLTARYEGLSGTFFGTADVLKNSISFRIRNRAGDIQIFLCAELPAAPAGQPVLNVYCVANSRSGRPVISNVVMVKADFRQANDYVPSEIDQLMKIKPVTLVFGELKDTKEEGVDRFDIGKWQEKEIITYLSRNHRVNKKLRGFSPNSFDHIRSRNNIAFERNNRDNYQRLKLRLKDHVFYAFNRFRQKMNEVAVFSYTFEFNDEEQICSATRHPIGDQSKSDFSGEIFLKGERICMRLEDSNLQRQRQFIAPFNLEINEKTNSFTFRGITSTVSLQTNNPMALRELVVGIPSTVMLKNFIPDDDKTNGYMSYQSFCKLDSKIIRNEEKLFIANQLMSTLSFPSKTDTNFSYYRQDKARRYEGDYSIFTFGSDNGYKPLKMALSIDALSQVVLRIRYEEDSADYVYYGIGEFYNNCLRISVHLDADYPIDDRHSEFLSDPVVEKAYRPSPILTGINLTANDENKAQAVRFVMISNAMLLNGAPSASGRPIGPASRGELKLLESILKTHNIPMPH